MRMGYRGVVWGVAILAVAACGESDDAPGAAGDAGSGATAGSNAGRGGRGGTAGSAGKSSAGSAGTAGTRANNAGEGGNEDGVAGLGGEGGSAATGGTSGGRSGSGGSAGSAGSNAAGAGTSGTSCAPLPEPEGTIVNVTPDDAHTLPDVARAAQAGTTILLEDGTYRLSGDESARRIQLTHAGVTLRSRSGNRDAVIIDGEYQTEEMITVNASDVTIADLTIMRAIHHPIHVSGGPEGDISGVLLHNLKIVDGGEQFVKVNTSGGDPNTYADDGILECSHFELTDEGRPHVVPDPGGCYTGGIDAHQARGWIVRQNTFVGIHCTNGSLAEHAIHFWTSSRDTLVERNTIIDCARGIGFGLGDGGGNPPDRSYGDDPYPGVGYVGHYDGVIRNNVIATTENFEFFDTGIELEQARGTRVLHNTVIHGSTAFASVSARFENTLVTLENNLLRESRERDGASIDGSSSIEGVPNDLFVDVPGLDFHLRPSAALAIDAALPLDDAGDDIDGTPHDNGPPDLGADEYRAE